jgi:serine/threonine-protein kinase
MNKPHDPNRTVDVPSSTPADSLDAGLAAGFGRATPPRSSLGDIRPVLLTQVDGESSLVVKPKSNAMPPKEQTGDRYRLDGEIARGGMGAVLRGRDVDLGRDLAVKVLLEKHANRPEVVQRFLEEAQIGGQLQHPGVVPVYDIGRFGERPFFTMKLVKGHTLAALLGERTNPAQDRPRLLGIALQVSQAVAYAHAKGVIHRDLKPANVMVGAFGEVQVMDWGLAKVLAEGGVADEERASRTHHQEEGTLIRTARSSGSAGSFGTDTEAGSLLGTPAYMPPEQANGDVALMDRRADVFGLGAILCEVLTGKPPYVGRSSEEVRRKAANGDLADALLRLDGCGADSELIVLTKACLSPEAIDRPRDARAVAEGLTAYLDGVQERLHQAELAEAEARARASEEAKRRRLTLALAGTILLALTLGGGGWLFVKNERDARQAQLAREVNEALNKATSLREKARTAPTGGAALLAQAREQAQRALALMENGPDDEALVTQVRRLQTELDEEEKDQKLVAALDEARLAQAQVVVGESRFAAERAVPRFREAFRDYGLPAGQGEAKDAAARIRGRPAAVREAIVAALDEWDDLANDPGHRRWLRAVLESAEPGDAWSRKVRAASTEKGEAKRSAALEQLATSADVARVPARALTRLARQLAPAAQVALLRRAQAQSPSDFWVNHDLGQALAAARPPQRGEAVRFLTAANALRPDSPGCLLHLGLALQENGRVDEAITCYNKAIALEPKLAAVHYNLGNALLLKGRHDGAIASFQKAIALDRKDAQAHVNLGIALERRGRHDEAIASHKKAIEVDPKLAAAHCNLGAILCDVKRDYDGAIVCFHKAIDLDPKHALARANLGKALAAKGRSDEAIASYKKAIAIDPRYAPAHNNLGTVLAGKGELDEAIACYRKAIALDPKYAMAHSNLGNALKARGQVDEAIACFKKVIEFNPKLAAAHDELGAILCDVKQDYDGAVVCFKKAIALTPKDANAHFSLGNALLGQGRLDAAISSYRKAIELDPKSAGAHFGLGCALGRKGWADEAIASYRKAIALDPTHAEAHCNLGTELANKGLFAESLASVKRGHELGSKRANWRYPSAAWVRQAETKAALEAKLPALLKGEHQPADNRERLGLAGVCRAKRLHRAAAGLYAAAFAAEPKLADDLKGGHRYNAACIASLAASRQGEDAGKLDDKERTRLRKQALDWLKADLALRARQVETGKPADRAEMRRVLLHWQQDLDLAGLRDKDALAKLPADEQKAFTQLWADVAELLKNADTPTTKKEKK